MPHSRVSQGSPDVPYWQTLLFLAGLVTAACTPPAVLIVSCVMLLRRKGGE